MNNYTYFSDYQTNASESHSYADPAAGDYLMETATENYSDSDWSDESYDDWWF